MLQCPPGLLSTSVTIWPRVPCAADAPPATIQVQNMTCPRSQVLWLTHLATAVCVQGSWKWGGGAEGWGLHSPSGANSAVDRGLGHELQGQGRGSARDLRETTGLPVCSRLVPRGHQSLQMAGQSLKIHVAHRSRKAGCVIHSLASCPQWRALAKGLRGGAVVWGLHISQESISMVCFSSNDTPLQPHDPK